MHLNTLSRRSQKERMATFTGSWLSILVWSSEDILQRWRIAEEGGRPSRKCLQIRLHFFVKQLAGIHHLSDWLSKAVL